MADAKVFLIAVSILDKLKQDENINVKEECNKLDLNSKKRKKILSLIKNYLDKKYEIKSFKKNHNIKPKKENLNENLINLMLTEIFYSRCYKENTFDAWEEASFLQKYSYEIQQKKNTIVLSELPKAQKKQHDFKLKRSNEIVDNKNRKKILKRENIDKQVDLYKDILELNVKYVRVNKIKMTMNELVNELINKLNFIQVGRYFDNFNLYLKKLFNLKEQEFMLDYHFPDDLIVIHKESKKEFIDFNIYKNGKIILQDKASLIALKCANLVPGMRIADICCAPGTKTAAIASMLENKCEIISIDINGERIESMRELMNDLYVNCTKIIEMDFTKVTLNEFKYKNSNKIDVLFLDPSCSGSGMIDKRGEVYNKDQDDRKRLLKLASFQTRLLCHAMSLEPTLIIYSTCSFSVWENEFVICKAFEQAENHGDYELVEGFKEWPQRGEQQFTCAKYVIRSGPNRGTRGFFTAVLKRKK